MINEQLGGMEDSIDENTWEGVWLLGYWVGAKCDGGNDIWKWGDGSELDGGFTNWYTGEPNGNGLLVGNNNQVGAYVFPVSEIGLSADTLGKWGDDLRTNKKNYICQSKPCIWNPCVNGGQCVSSGHDYSCKCLAGYDGTHCEIDIDECASNPCLNGGTCTDGVASFTCACVNGYTGADCSTNIDDCASMPCLNGGTCTDGVASFTCACVNGYIGADCSTNIDDCASTPCLNGGTCTDGVASFTCACVNGYIGDICETDLCEPNPCNNGTCNHAHAGYQCICQDGYVGDHCETDLCEPNPCNNSGSCVRVVGSFTCDCQPAFMGQLCAEAKFEENDLNENLLHINYQASSLSSFSKSSDLCELNKQAGLVIIKDLETQQVIEKQTSSMYNGEGVQLWIGAKKTNDGWFWLDGSHMTFQYWSETGSDVMGSCLKMISQSGSEELRWLPGDCDETMGYICEQPINLVDPCGLVECYNSGTCTSSGAHYHCQCVEGYKGEDCATKISDPCSSQSTIIIALSCVIGFLLLVVVATVIYFVRRQPVVDKNVGQHCNKAFKDDAVYEHIEDVYVGYNIEKNKLLERFENLSSNSNVGFVIQFAEMAKELNFTSRIRSNNIFKIPSEATEGAYVNEGNPQVFIASHVDCSKLWNLIMTQQCWVVVGFPETNNQFYPDVKVCATYGNVKVLTNKKKSFKYFSIVEIEASNQTTHYESVSRKIKLFEFNNWSDCDVINSSFVWFVNKVSESLLKVSDDSSVIVYGSDSATSLFVAYQRLTRCLKHQNQVNIFQQVAQLRKLNVSFFANLECYILLHQLLVEQQHLGNTDLSLLEVKESRSPRVRREFEFLQKTVKHEVHASVTLISNCGTTLVFVNPVEKVETFWTKIFVENPDLIVSCDKTKSLRDLGFTDGLNLNFGEMSLELKHDATSVEIRRNDSKHTVALKYLETTRSIEDLISASNNFRRFCQKVTGVVVVTSWESVTMVALSQLIERIESESKFDVFRVVRDLGLKVTMEQYELLYKCLSHHGSDLYANTTC
uniref:uncharacterized protein LOC100181677 isoform X2 n=1 Tax=Ciona intestinalis TaxID=7719 RepID=UPI000EF44828|nr:uncharacterized protein LOC100181677 isoform X2 [Ciona intestinalis]|eukprot:XP_026695377.1 uncharacterized protein LOC100181677 isoform X2 [Ciona intestinalis]